NQNACSSFRIWCSFHTACVFPKLILQKSVYHNLPAFMLNYVLTTMLNRIIDANLFNDNFDFDRANAFYPSSVTNFLYIQSFDRSAKWITAVNCSGAIVILLGFIIVMNLRKDKGV
ncbi:hypothetical protein, partial [Ruminococcus sp. AM31-15AC]|uniref:hypothetical protein n=1 Tax=Ruminococcus sp. AM31-15AC TaxID=2293202 RepID=UPI0015F42BB2